MSDVMRELKAEISRLARKEISKELEPVKRVNAMQRGLIADLRRMITALQKDVSGLQKSAGERPLQVVESGAGKDKKDARMQSWITGKGVRTIRKRLGLTQPELARLAGVSAWTVVNWESTEGKISIRRKETARRIQEIRSMGKRTAAESLATGKA